MLPPAVAPTTHATSMAPKPKNPANSDDWLTWQQQEDFGARKVGEHNVCALLLNSPTVRGSFLSPYQHPSYFVNASMFPVTHTDSLGSLNKVDANAQRSYLQPQRSSLPQSQLDLPRSPTPPPLSSTTCCLQASNRRHMPRLVNRYHLTTTGSLLIRILLLHLHDKVWSTA